MFLLHQHPSPGPVPIPKVAQSWDNVVVLVEAVINPSADDADLWKSASRKIRGRLVRPKQENMVVSHTNYSLLVDVS